MQLEVAVLWYLRHSMLLHRPALIKLDLMVHDQDDHVIQEKQ